jgi:DNA repair exonuclease SbcCD ATPase subunit
MQRFRNLLEQEKGKVKEIDASIKEEKVKLKEIDKDFRNVEEAIPIVQLVAQQTQDELRYHISELVTLALAAIWDDPYEFDIDFVTKRGKTEANISFLRNGNKISPMEASGGGAVDVASFALRIAMWKLHSHKTISNTLIFDEPFRFLSLDLQDKAGKMLKELSETLGIQFIIVTHSKGLVEQADKVYTVKMKNNISKVTEGE